MHVATSGRDARWLKLNNVDLRVSYTWMALFNLDANEAITGNIINVSTTKVIYSFMFNLIESDRPVNILTNFIQVKIDACFVITGRIEGRNAGARAERLEHLERFIRFSCDCWADFVIYIDSENLTQALTVDIDASNCKEEIAYDEACCVDSSRNTGKSRYDNAFVQPCVKT